MPRTATHVVINRTRCEALTALNEMGDDTLARAIPQYMVPWFDQHPNRWNPNEPEFEQTIVALRTQAIADINVALGHRLDNRCDNQLGVGRDPATGNRMLTHFDAVPDECCANCGEEDCDCDEEDREPEHRGNTVQRLLSLGVLNAPNPIERLTDAMIASVGGFPAYNAPHITGTLTESAASYARGGIRYTTVTQRNEGTEPF